MSGILSGVEGVFKKGESVVGEVVKEGFLATKTGQTAAMVWDGGGALVHTVGAVKDYLKGDKAGAEKEGAKALEDVALTVEHEKLRNASVGTRVAATMATDAIEHFVDKKIDGIGQSQPAPSQTAATANYSGAVHSNQVPQVAGSNPLQKMLQSFTQPIEQAA